MGTESGAAARVEGAAVARRALAVKSSGEVTLIEVPTEGDYDREKAAAADIIVYNARGSRSPLVVVRTWSKEGKNFRAVAHALGPEQPIYSLAPPDFQTLEEYPRRSEERRVGKECA